MSAILIYTIGYPGAGKTAFAKNLANQLDIEHLQGDKIGYLLFTQPKFTPEEVRMVRSTMERLVIENLAKGRSVIYDAMLHTRASRQDLAAIAATQNKQAVGVWIQTPEKTARQRAGAVRVADFNKDYMRIVPADVFDHHLQLFEEPGARERVIKLWGTASFSMQYASFRAQARSMNIALL